MRILRLLCAASAALALSVGATAAASADTATPKAAAAPHSAAATATHSNPKNSVTAVLDVPESGQWTRSVRLAGSGAATSESAVSPNLVHPDSGQTCNDWDFYLYDVCIEVWGSGDNVTAVEGWADTFGGGWVIIYDQPDGILNGSIPAGWDDEYYSFGPGGKNFPTDDNLCAHSDYAGKSICLEIHP